MSRPLSAGRGSSWRGCWPSCPGTGRAASGRPRWGGRGCSSGCAACSAASPGALRCCWYWRTCTGPIAPPWMSWRCCCAPCAGRGCWWWAVTGPRIPVSCWRAGWPRSGGCQKCAGWSCRGSPARSWPPSWPGCGAARWTAGSLRRFSTGRRVTRSSPSSCVRPVPALAGCRWCCGRCCWPGCGGCRRPASSCCGWRRWPAGGSAMTGWRRSPARRTRSWTAGWPRRWAAGCWSSLRWSAPGRRCMSSGTRCCRRPCTGSCCPGSGPGCTALTPVPWPARRPARGDPAVPCGAG